jgi:exopolysaccharide biosynthesis polyprenyl glycosylphosphotransferase
MTPVRRKLLLEALKLFDLVMMAFLFLLAAWISTYHIKRLPFSQVLTIRISISNMCFFLGFLLSWHMIFSFLKMYHSKRLSSLQEDIPQIIKATTFGVIVLSTAAVLFNIRLITPYFILAFWVTTTVGSIASRLALKYVMEKIRKHGRNLRTVLIIGTNARTMRFVRKILNSPEYGYQLIGFVDEGRGLAGFEKTGHPLVADFNSFPALLRTEVIDEVVIGLPIKSFYQQISQIVSLCEKQGILVRFLSDIFNLDLDKVKPEEFDEGAFITVSMGTMEGVPLIVKYLLDFVFSLVLLILLSPTFLVVALLTKMTSSGPVFFVQDRVGLHKRIFRLYKFRTMVVDAEARMAELEKLNEVDGPAFKIKNDPRITALGRLLRKTSIDELPQLINVLKGEMSLVGPRPLPIRDYRGFNQDWHRRRFSVKPGMTCLWQINGRNQLSFSDWMNLDIKYVDNWSLGMDLMILIKTIPAVLKGSGAS